MHEYVTVICGNGRACSVLITHGNERTEPDCETLGIFRASAKLSNAQAQSIHRKTTVYIFFLPLLLSSASYAVVKMILTSQSKVYAQMFTNSQCVSFNLILMCE